MKKTVFTLTLLISAINSIACTGMIVGKNASADGTMIFARNEDFSSGFNPKRFIVVNARNISMKKASDILKNPDTGFSHVLPRKTYKYTLIPDVDQNYGIFGEAGTNEMGVMVSATVSAKAGDEILKYDPYVKGGITEPDMASLVLMSATSARKGVEIIADIIDKKGAGEGNIIFVSDQNEIWYMEIYTGHQYVAVKVPDDVYALVPNAYYLGNVDLQSKDTIASKDIKNLPLKHNLLKENEKGFHLALTYREPQSKYNQIRIWATQNRLNPSTKEEFDNDKTFELFRKPDKKIELKEVMTILRDRYKGTKYYNNSDYRPIGIETNLETHIFQVRKNLPPIMWLSFGPVEHSVFVPHYGNITSTPKEYSSEHYSYNSGSLYWTSKLINVFGKVDRATIGDNIMKYWSSIEDQFIKN
ncbi:C69 family dipeptidase [Caviibacter abscessus]|nr:C69 family dipeptidase [Caviibacter abscessus]